MLSAIPTFILALLSLRRPRGRGCNPIPAFGVTCLPATCLNHWVYNKVGYFAYWIGLSIAWMGMALLMSLRLTVMQ